MKIKFNSYVDLSLRKSLEPYFMRIDVRSVFYEGNKYYPHVLLDGHLYKL